MNSIISDADYSALKKSAHKSRTDNNLLSKIARKARIVKHLKLPRGTVQLNSLVVLWHSVLKKVVRFRIVLPDKADIQNKSISVFAPVSMAIFGLKERDSVNVYAGGIEKRLRIIKVINE